MSVSFNPNSPNHYEDNQLYQSNQYNQQSQEILIPESESYVSSPTIPNLEIDEDPDPDITASDRSFEIYNIVQFLAQETLPDMLNIQNEQQQQQQQQHNNNSKIGALSAEQKTDSYAREKIMGLELTPTNIS